METGALNANGYKSCICRYIAVYQLVRPALCSNAMGALIVNRVSFQCYCFVLLKCILFIYKYGDKYWDGADRLKPVSLILVAQINKCKCLI